MEYTKGLELYLKSAPRRYGMTPQQKKLKDVARECGIKAGIKKADLMIAMKECIGPRMKAEAQE